MVGALLKVLTFQVNEASALLAGSLSSVTVMVTEYGLLSPASSEIVPEIRPVDESMDNPAGKPVALKLSVSPSLSAALTGRLITSLVMPVWSDIGVMVGALLDALTLQVNEATALLAGSPSSVTVMVTL